MVKQKQQPWKLKENPDCFFFFLGVLTKYPYFYCNDEIEKKRKMEVYLKMNFKKFI